MIALDVMGGDFAPNVTVHGAINAAKQGVPVALFGDEAQILSLLATIYPSWWSLPLTIIHCSEVIEMGEEPTRGVVKKKDASLIRAIKAVADGHASAIVSAGNSGAALVAGTLIIERVSGIHRPALGNFLPTKNGSVFCIDLGANADCKPEFLEQFAIMGHLYVQAFKGIQNPRIALLSNGAEPYKGSMIIKETFSLLERNTLINFVGNLEPRDLFDGGADVIVCDGFAGNIMLKTAQGAAQAISFWLKQAATKTWYHKMLFGLGSGVFKELKQKTDYASRGGALLLGLQRPLIVAHGCSTAAAIEKAILFAHEMANNQTMNTFNKALAELIKASRILQIPTEAKSSRMRAER
ncbi:MAG TPA: phosphate acyltransferase PlsX [Candidatus Babeliales bacterium]|nr:phosphate acyltransferase PlsX [Candidatus Babeliales bacterium]